MKPSSELLDLGRHLVEQLWPDGQHDVLGRWMAQDLASKIEAAEVPDATGAEKLACAEAILAVWKHRYDLPPDRRPLADLVPLFETLKRIDPGKRTPSYFQRNEKAETDTEKWLDAAQILDLIARVLIKHCLLSATEASGEAVALAELAQAAGLESPEFSVVTIVRGWDLPTPSPVERRGASIRALRADLKTFRRAAAMLDQGLKAELEALGPLPRRTPSKPKTKAATLRSRRLAARKL